MPARIVVLELVALLPTAATGEPHPAEAKKTESEDFADCDTPDGVLVTFTSLVPNGEWHLLVHDDGIGDVSSLDGRTLVVRAKVKARPWRSRDG